MSIVTMEYKVRKSIFTVTKTVENSFERAVEFLNSVKNSVRRTRQSIIPCIKKQLLKVAGLRNSIEITEKVLPEIYKEAISAESYAESYGIKSNCCFAHTLNSSPVRWKKIFVELESVPSPVPWIYQEGNYYFLVRKCWYAVEKNGQFFSIDEDSVDEEFIPTDGIISLVEISEEGITVYLLI